MEKLRSFEKIFEVLAISKQISILTHIKPDGDAIGSSLALLHFCKRIGKKVKFIHNDNLPNFCQKLYLIDRAESIEGSESESLKQWLAESDLVFILDVNNIKRLGSPGEFINFNNTTSVVLDHHINPEESFTYLYQDEEAIATAEIIYKFIWAYSYLEKNKNLPYSLSRDSFLNFADKHFLNYFDKQIATNIYTGILTDSGNFKFFRTDAEVLRIAANLLEFGLDLVFINKVIFDSMSFNKYQLKKRYIENTKFYFSKQCVISYLTEKDFAECNSTNDDTEGFSSIPLEIETTKIAIFIQKELNALKGGENTYRISFRSFGEINANKMAVFFGGGGHYNASGATVYSYDLNQIINLSLEFVQNNYFGEN